MAQSPWVTIPTSTSSSMTSTDRTRSSRIWRKASTTMSPERTWIRAPLFWARASLTVFIESPLVGRVLGAFVNDKIRPLCSEQIAYPDAELLRARQFGAVLDLYDVTTV